MSFLFTVFIVWICIGAISAFFCFISDLEISFEVDEGKVDFVPYLKLIITGPAKLIAWAVYAVKGLVS